MLHDMAPVTGGVADRQQNRLVLRLGVIEHFLTPGLPVDRVVLVLQEIRAGFFAETVGLERIDHGARGGPDKVENEWKTIWAQCNHAGGVMIRALNGAWPWHRVERGPVFGRFAGATS
jgi:hypothetical protein